MYQIVYYRTPRGEEGVKSFLDDLEQKVQWKVYSYLALLKNEGPNLRRPYADIVEGKIRELRVQFARNQIRILYFFFHKEQIVLLGGFKKKEWAVDPREIEKATQRMAEWVARHSQGELL